MPDPFESEIYEPSFQEIQDPDSLFYDKNWFESDLLPWDHNWYEIIGGFLVMRASIRRYEYTGKNQELALKQITALARFNNLIPEIEDMIRFEVDGIEFTQKWTEFCRAYDACGIVKREHARRQKSGQFDRGVEQRRAWYATVYQLEKSKGKKGAVIKGDIAKFAEQIRAGQLKVPDLWHELKFDKILHEDSTLKGPKLNKDLDKEMNVKVDIPYYAEQVAPGFKLPPFDIKISG